MAVPRDALVIDLFGLEIDNVRDRFPAVYQWILEKVKPERDQNNRQAYRDRWWVFGEPVKTTREALAGLDRYIVTCRTAKHRVFTLLNSDIISESKLVTIALDDAFSFGVLSSRIHTLWALQTGAFLEDRPTYNHSDCFGKFPFPAASAAQQARIRAVAERLDAHRKRQQERHPTLTLTDMYNVLEHLRALVPNRDHPNPDREGGEPADGSGVVPSLTVGVPRGGAALAEAPAPYQPIPLAYLITFRTYGTWLPGDEGGTVDDTHNAPGAPMLPPDPRRESQARDLMDQPAYTLDAPRQAIVLQTIQEVCAYRGWSLLAAHVRTNHVHVVVHASQAPEKAMTDFKAYTSRKLNAAGFDEPERKRWSRHGSTRYLWQPEHVEAAIRYVVHEQGESMAVYENQERIVTSAPVTFEKALKEAGGVYFAQSVLDLPEVQIEDIDAPNPDREGGEPAGGIGAFPSLTVGVRRELPLPFSVKEREIHEQGLISILRQLHDELDAAVADAYGWPANLPDGEILQRLVDLNAQRAAEEASGLIRWLRPAYQQARAGVAPVQATLVEDEAGAEGAAPALAQPLPWPASMPEQARAVRSVLQQAAAPLTPAEAAAYFGRADKARVAELLATLASLGQAGEEAGRYGAV